MNTSELVKSLDEKKTKLNEPLAPYTTLKVGGPADILYTADSTDDLVKTVKLARKHDIPVTLLGWGSNVLISDAGIKGLVIRVKSDGIKILEGKNTKSEKITIESKTKPRLGQADKEEYYDFTEIDYDESEYPIVQVQIDAGVPLPLAINALIGKGVTGLQWFAGIPGTLGGAIYNNIHGGAHFIEEFVDSVQILNEKLELETLTKEKLEFDYDYSRFHKTKETILSGIFNLRKGDSAKARATSIEWARRKKIQPARSAGCCWRNIDEETQKKLKFESNSWGYIIDKKLGLKGETRGGAKISEAHAAFIETDDTAKASDVLELMKLVYKESQEKLGIVPKPEIFLLGFEEGEIKEFS